MAKNKNILTEIVQAELEQNLIGLKETTPDRLKEKWLIYNVTNIKGGNVSAFGSDNSTKFLWISNEKEINIYFENTKNDYDDIFSSSDFDNELASNFTVHTDFEFVDKGSLLDKRLFLITKNKLINNNQILSYDEQEIYFLKGREIKTLASKRASITLENLDRLKSFANERFNINPLPNFVFNEVKSINYSTLNTSPLLASFAINAKIDKAGIIDDGVEILAKMNKMVPVLIPTSSVKKNKLQMYLPWRNGDNLLQADFIKLLGNKDILTIFSIVDSDILESVVTRTLFRKLTVLSQWYKRGFTNILDYTDAGKLTITVGKYYKDLLEAKNAEGVAGVFQTLIDREFNLAETGFYVNDVIDTNNYNGAIISIPLTDKWVIGTPDEIRIFRAKEKQRFRAMLSMCGKNVISPYATKFGNDVATLEMSLPYFLEINISEIKPTTGGDAEPNHKDYKYEWKTPIKMKLNSLIYNLEMQATAAGIINRTINITNTSLAYYFQDDFQTRQTPQILNVQTSTGIDLLTVGNPGLFSFRVNNVNIYDQLAATGLVIFLKKWDTDNNENVVSYRIPNLGLTPFPTTGVITNKQVDIILTGQFEFRGTTFGFDNTLSGDRFDWLIYNLGITRSGYIKYDESAPGAIINVHGKSSIAFKTHDNFVGTSGRTLEIYDGGVRDQNLPSFISQWDDAQLAGSFVWIYSETNDQKLFEKISYDNFYNPPTNGTIRERLGVTNDYAPNLGINTDIIFLLNANEKILNLNEINFGFRFPHAIQLIIKTDGGDIVLGSTNLTSANYLLIGDIGNETIDSWSIEI